MRYNVILFVTHVVSILFQCCFSIGLLLSCHSLESPRVFSVFHNTTQIFLFLHTAYEQNLMLSLLILFDFVSIVHQCFALVLQLTRTIIISSPSSHRTKWFNSPAPTQQKCSLSTMIVVQKYALVFSERTATLPEHVHLRVKWTGYDEPTWNESESLLDLLHLKQYIQSNVSLQSIRKLWQPRASNSFSFSFSFLLAYTFVCVPRPLGHCLFVPSLFPSYIGNKKVYN